MARPKRNLVGGIETLPPPGDERREVLAERADALAERAEAAGIEGGRMDPRALRVENELAQHFDELEVTDADPAYRYCWVNSGRYGLYVKMKLSEGWEVVQGDMPEAIGLKGMGLDTTRRLGDVILMRIQLDRYLKIVRQRTARQKAHQEGVTSRLKELGARHGITVHTDASSMNPKTFQAMQARAAAASHAASLTDQWIREGRMPGVPSPGAA